MQHAAYLNRPRTILADFTGQRPWQSCTAPWIDWCFCIQSHDDGDQNEINIRCQLVGESRRKTIAKAKRHRRCQIFKTQALSPAVSYHVLSCPRFKKFWCPDWHSMSRSAPEWPWTPWLEEYDLKTLASSGVVASEYAVNMFLVERKESPQP